VGEEGERLVAGSGAIVGVRLRPLLMHADARGSLTELFREEWELGARPVQWNLTHSAANVLRGVHVNPRHTDYLILTSGSASVGLRDLRRGSPTEGRVTLLELRGERLAGLMIPPGVAHGVLFHQPSTHILGLTEYWHPDDEIRCHWADPALEIPWPVSRPSLSAPDASAPPLAEILDRVPPYRPA
jgi:dTDP-4-dehydrorhamnose 3,5-epimerase